MRLYSRDVSHGVMPMSLSEAQRNLIESSISHLIDIPTDRAEFAHTEKILFDLFVQQTTDNEDLALLLKCFQHPTEYFKNLELQGPPVSIGDVQTYIVEYIGTQLNKSGFALTVWNAETILAPLRDQPAWKAVFATEKEKPANVFDLLQLHVSADSLFDGEVGHDRGVITDGETNQQEVILWPFVKYKLYFPNEEPRASKVRLGHPILAAQLGNQIDEFSYIQSINRQAFLIAATQATVNAMVYLHVHGVDISPPVINSFPQEEYAGLEEEEQEADIDLDGGQNASQQAEYQADDEQDYEDDDSGILDFDATDDDIAEDEQAVPDNEQLPPGAIPINLALTPAIGLLVTQRFYFENFLNKTIAIRDVYAINPEKAAIFLEQGIINCIKSNLAGLRFSELVMYSLAELKILSHPSVVELIRKNILSVERAKKITEIELRIINHSTYYGLLLSGELSLDAVLNVHDDKTNILLLPPITNLILAHKLTFQQALDFPAHTRNVFMAGSFDDLFKRNVVDPLALQSLSKEHCEFILNPTIVRMLSKEEIRLAAIAAIPVQDMQFFVRSAFLKEWLKLGYIDFQDVLRCRSEQKKLTYVKGLITNIQAVLIKHPSPILSKDEIEKLFNDMASIAEECNMTIQDMNMLIAKVFAELAQQMLLQVRSEIDTSQFEPIFTKLTDLLTEKMSAENPYWVSTYDEAGQLAWMISKKSSSCPIANYHLKRCNYAFHNEDTASPLPPALVKLKLQCQGLLAVANLMAKSLDHTNESRVSAKL